MQKLHPPHALFWAGIDLAKATFQAALWGHDDFRAMRVHSFPRCEEGARALLALEFGHFHDCRSWLGPRTPLPH